MNKLIQKRTFITIVNQAEVAYRQFVGMNRVKLNPGIRIKIPFLHQVIDPKNMYPLPHMNMAK